MHKINMFSVVIVAIMFQFLVFIIPDGSVLAEDTSSAAATFYEKDGWSQCFNAAFPHHIWANLDTIYFRDYIYRGWTCQPDPICGFPENHMLIRYYSFKATDPPPESPALIELEQPYITNTILNTGMRFAVFNDQMFIVYANYYIDQGTYHVFFTQSTDGVNWGNMTQDTGLGGTGQVQGLIAKVMNDKVYVFMQLQGEKDIYCVTYDGTSWSSPSQDQKIYSFNNNECILSGDVFFRSSDGEPCLFMVTNDETNTNNLLVYDSTGDTIYYTGAALPVHLKNAVVLQGNITNSTPYNIGSIQIWGIEQETNNIWHFQYTVNADGHSGAIYPKNQVKVTDVAPKATASTHIADDTWNYMAACSIPVQVVDDDQNVSLQLYDWVWWWGSTTATAAYGRSLKYTADYLKNSVVGEATSSADPNDPNVVNGINKAWVLLGVITGLPPYYPNGIEQEWLGDYYKIAYGVRQVTEVSTTVKTERNFSVSYEKKFKPEHASIGGSYANAAEDANKEAFETEAHTVLEFKPTAIMPGMENGDQAWAIFLAPYIVNSIYDVFAPDKTTDLDMQIYYTYIGDNSSIVAKLFNMTAPSGFFAGITPMPNSLDYDAWKTEGLPIPSTGTADYNVIMQKQLLCESCGSEFSFDQTKKVETEHTSTNTLTVKGGAFGFESELEGSLSMSSSNSTSLGMNITITYELPGYYEVPDPEPADFGSWLTTMDMNMYLLNAKTSNAPWIPTAAKNPGTQQYPWCLTWKVNAYTNMENQPLHVGASQQHKTVSAVLEGQPDQENISIVLHDSISEPEPVMISGKSVSILGDYAALSNNGRPAITLSSLGFTVEEGAHLHLENLIIDSANIGNLPGISNRGSITIRNCTIKAGGDGIFQENGNLVLTNSLIVNCGGNGVKVAEGSLEAYNCELTLNHGYGLQLESGAAFLNHCSLLLNSTADLFSDGQTATAEALNSAFGVVSPDSRIFLMTHCLVETLPETVVIETQESCRMNTPAGYIYENGEIAGLSPNSALMNAGMAKIPDTRDIRGNLRDETPDIGYIEHTDFMELQSIKDFNLQTITNPDPDTATDALAFTLNLKVPENLTLKKDGRYAVFFGDYLISSSDFDQSSIDSDNTRLAFTGPGNSSMSLEYEPGSAKLIFKVSLYDIHLYQDISRYVAAAESGTTDSTFRVSLPITAVAAEDFQTGDVMMNFKFNVKDGAGAGSGPRLTGDDGSSDDDGSCFISALK